MEQKNSKISGSKSWCCKYNIIAVTLIAFGISMLLFLPDYLQKQMNINLELQPDSRTFPEWKKPTVPLYMDIYIFNWTNPEDINNHTTKPIVKQLGPYRFREYPDKHNITFHDNNNTVTYRKSSLFYFEENGSNGTLDDVVSVVNMLAVGAAATAQYWGFLRQLSVSTSLSGFGQKISVRKTVREILFEGYYDSMLTIGSMFDSEATLFDTVGFMVKKNGTDLLTGKYNVHTGVGDISKLGQIQKYRDLNEFPYYEGECRKLKGSPGEFYPPGRSSNDILYLFTPELCRALPYEYKKDINHLGIKGNRYYLDDRAIDNGEKYSENSCYMTESLPSGFINISACNFGQPLYMSYPHFYKADKSFLDAIDGLSPQKDLHESYITLEPKTSVTLEAVGRLQTNLYLRPYGFINLFKNVPRLMLPLFFVEQKFIMGEEHASELYYGLLIFSVSKYIGVLLIIVGVAFIACRRCMQCKSKQDNKNDLEINEKEATALMT
ncbi:hypothetical protein PVAND_009968 [Polypedilum vanderplanki]|uniref:Uncharacterized protein n=1 Tax=Polypedilum vanderplanki TaxID=319348 RepID=A0A9J6CEE6_POLVA|nr:hypothetical protein PVAND_009968 [Polypedilum vanderplanki]